MKKLKAGDVIERERKRKPIHQHSIPTLIKKLKGITARKLFIKYPVLKKSLWGGHLWDPSYFIATVSDNTEAQIKAYIQNTVGTTEIHACGDGYYEVNETGNSNCEIRSS